MSYRVQERYSFWRSAMDPNSVLDSAFFEAPVHNPEKPMLLFFSPVIPSTSGGGTAMRAFLEIEVASRTFNVALCVVAIYDQLQVFADARHISEKCISVTVIPGRTPLADMHVALTSFGRTNWDVIHVFR